MIDLIGIGAIIVGLTFFLCLAHYDQRKRQREMGLRDLTEPLHDLRQPRQADEDWRSAAPAWSNPRYYNGAPPRRKTRSPR